MSIIKETSRGYNTLQEEDILLTSRKVFLTKEVTAETASKLIRQLMVLDDESDEEVTFFINSPGGDVLSGLAVYDFIKTMRSPVRTVCIGTCFSMGAILFLAGSTREIYEHSQVMIHDPSYLTNDIGGKKPLEIQSTVDKLVKMRDVLARIIAEATGKPLRTILKLTREDAFFTAEEALKFGLATAIVRSNKEG